jgi:hypothetical protein
MTTLHLSHTQKRKKWIEKICQNNVKIKIKNKASSNENFISEVH